MKFKLNDFIKSTRNGTIGCDTIQQVIEIKRIDDKDYYVLKRISGEYKTILELTVKFVDKGYGKW